MTYTAAIFDLDGTLVHTKPSYRYSTTGHVLNILGIREWTNNSIDRFWFGYDRNGVIKNEFGLNPEIFWPEFRKQDTGEKRIKFTEAYDDIEVIRELKGYGIKTGIVTGASLHVAYLELGLIGEDCFDAVVIAQLSNGIQPKPHPHGLNECLSLLEVQKDQAIYVGNAEEDVLTSRAAGVFDIIIDRDEHGFEYNVTPSLTIHSLHELKELLG